MNCFASTVFGIGAAVTFSWFLLAAFVGSAKSGQRVVASFVVGGALFLFSVYFDRRDARIRNRSPTMILPSRRGFFSFLLVMYYLLGLACFFTLFVLILFRLPEGDSWTAAAARLAFCVGVLIVGCLIHQAFAAGANRWFAGHVDDDYLESLGKPFGSQYRTENTEDKTSVWFWVATGGLCSALLWYGMDWALPFFDVDLSAGSRAGKSKAKIRWLVRHPNTVRLFAAACLAVCLSAICHTLVCWWNRRPSGKLNDE